MGMAASSDVLGVKNPSIHSGFLHESQADCTHGEFSAGDDCNSYNLCSNGELVEFHCPSGLYWNQAEKACSGDPTAGCGAAAGTDDNEAAAGPQPAVEEQDLDGSGTQWDFKVVCYFTNWAWYRPGLGRYTPDNIDPELCTHIVYGFATLDYSTLTMSVYDSWADLDNKFYEKVVAYKKKGIKVTIAIGGWNDSAGDKYSRMVRDSAARKRFVDAAVQFVDKYGFDGLDLDWEYPKCWQRAGRGQGGLRQAGCGAPRRLQAQGPAAVGCRVPQHARRRQRVRRSYPVEILGLDWRHGIRLPRQLRRPDWSRGPHELLPRRLARGF
ncbi:hypothetical protein ONE63_004600 [Megalurothrips usitatus]|uniref:Chitinase n=1 Tax=Megalurothrips usitatus TaxID=439358 RepID=A0AAV7X476_9NEOP|nr:hypothetical protein ONE63_004600 [Megalurothrips usitatus]